MEIGRVRPAVQALASYRPGKAASQAEEEHGITGAIKLASNENPYEPVGAVVRAIEQAASDVNRYGDHRAAALRSRIADWLGLNATNIGIGCGSVGILQQLCLAYVDPGDEVVYPWPSFEAYPIMVKMMGGRPVNPPLIDHRIDLDSVAEAVGPSTKLVLIATPNNPTGTAVGTSELAELLARVSSDVIVMVDEAYREFCDPSFGDPVRDLLPHHPNLIVSRTFSKAYGLAGLRIGYGAADPELITELDKVLLAFSVNSVAQAAATAAIDSLPEIEKRVGVLIAERDRVVAGLVEAGWELPDAQANFVYVPLGSDAERVGLELERRGVVVRPFPGDGVRVTIGTPAQNDRFLETFAEVTR